MIKEPFRFEHAMLPCGLEVYWQHKPEALYLKMGVLVWVGNIDNPPGKEGLAHLFEHLPFRGTELYPSQRKLVFPVEALGGSVGAGTAANITEFRAQVKAGEGRKAWTRLEQMLFFPLLRQEDLDAERLVVDSEIAQRTNNRSLEDEQRQWQLIGGQEFARAFDGLGTSESLRSIMLDDIHAFHQKHYRPSNMSVVFVGNLAEFTGGIELFLAGRFARAPLARRSRRRVITPSIGETPVSWETTGVPTRYPAVKVMAALHETGATLEADLGAALAPAMAIIGERLWSGDSSSVFLDELREKRGLVYSFGGARYHLDQNLAWWSFGGLFRRNEDVTVALALLRNRLTKPRYLSNAAIARAKRSIIGSHSMGDYGARRVYEWAFDHLQEDRRIMTQAERDRRIADTSPETVRACAEKYLDPLRWITTLYLPKE